jgi:hypothetical protein
MALKEARRRREATRVITLPSELGPSEPEGDSTLSLLVCAETEDQTTLLEALCHRLLSAYGYKGPANRRRFTGSHFSESDYQGGAERLERHLLAWFGNKRQIAGKLTKKEEAALVEFEDKFRDLAKKIEDGAKSEYEERKRELEAEIGRLKTENERLRNQNTSQQIQQLQNQIQESEKKSKWRKDPKFWISLGALLLTLIIPSGDGPKGARSGSQREGTVVCQQIPDEQRGSFKNAEADRGHVAKALANKIIERYIESQSDEE